MSIQNLECKQTQKSKNVSSDFCLLLSQTQKYLPNQLLIIQGFIIRGSQSTRLPDFSLPPAVCLMTSEVVSLSRRWKLILDKVKMCGYSAHWIALCQFFLFGAGLQLLNFSNYC